MVRSTVYMLFMILSLKLSGQVHSLKADLEKVVDYYQGKTTMALEMRYRLYHESTGALGESYSGSLYKKGRSHHIRILGSEVLQLGQVQLTVDHNNKAMLYKEIPSEALEATPFQMLNFIKYYKETASRVSGRDIIYELELEQAHLPLPYHKIVLHLNRSNYSITKQVFYLTKQVAFEGASKGSHWGLARMEVEFIPLEASSFSLPVLEDYMRESNGIKRGVSKAYSGYKFIDESAS